MTDREKAIVMAHTGVCMLTGDKFQIFHKYVEDIMGRPIWTHDIGWLEDEIKEKSKTDFIALCADNSGSEKSNKWIPVSERLPENAKHKGAFCPKYYVMTEFGQTEGWYNPDVGCWYVLLWFMDARFEKWNISLERGDVPKLVKNVPVVAWQPLPNPPKVGDEE